MHLDDTQTGTTSITSLQLAEERTALALVRTGFSAAAFGAGMTQLVGRGTWPDGGVYLLQAALAMIVFMTLLHSGLTSLK